MELVFTDTEARGKVASYLAGRETFADLADWIDQAAWDAPTPARERLALAIDEVRDGVRSEDELREDLAPDYTSRTSSSNLTFHFFGFRIVLVPQRSADVSDSHQLKLPLPA